MSENRTSVTTTGRAEQRDGGEALVLERRFGGPRDDVWAALTEPGRLERWIGTWTGDPAEGRVVFRMTAEGEDAPAEVMRIEVCEPPARLRVVSGGAGGEEWVMELDLTEARSARGVVTTLRFAQLLPLPEAAADIGPGWEYYLDRLVADLAGGDVAAVVWDDYLGLSASYAAMFGAG